MLIHVVHLSKVELLRDELCVCVCVCVEKMLDMHIIWACADMHGPFVRVELLTGALSVCMC